MSAKENKEEVLDKQFQRLELLELANALLAAVCAFSLLLGQNMEDNEVILAGLFGLVPWTICWSAQKLLLDSHQKQVNLAIQKGEYFKCY
jgi:hypothetical protein